jgi:hypothetical protein
MFESFTGVAILPDNRLLLFADGDVVICRDIATLSISTARSAKELFALPWATGKTVPLYLGADTLLLFNGPEFLRFDLTQGLATLDKPRPILEAWPGIWPVGIDAALNLGNGKLYFLRGPNCIRYDLAAERADEGYPKPIAEVWPGLWPAGVDAALCIDGLDLLFFHGTDHVRFNQREGRIVGRPTHNREFELSPLPSGLWRPARSLSLAQARAILLHLTESLEITLADPEGVRAGSALSNNGRVTMANPIGRMQFVGVAEPPVPFLEITDARMGVALWRLARWLSATDQTIQVVSYFHPHKERELGSSLDIAGVAGIEGRRPFRLSIASDWGAKPTVERSSFRLDPDDEPGYSLFRRLYTFAIFEAQVSDASHTLWPLPKIGQRSYIYYPDYFADGSPADMRIRQGHQDRFHFQLGPSSGL